MGTTEAERSNKKGSYPSGWLAISRHESIAHMLDAILDLPPNRGFTQTELAEMAGVSRQSVSRHLGFLIDIEAIEPIQDTSPQRFRFNPDSEVSQALIRLDGAMIKAGEDIQSTDG